MIGVVLWAVHLADQPGGPGEEDRLPRHRAPRGLSASRRRSPNRARGRAPPYPGQVSSTVPDLATLHAIGAAQQPTYPDQAAVDANVARLRRMPPLVFAGECDDLKAKMAAVVARRGVPAPGRRLRRDLRRGHRRQRAQQAARAAPDGGHPHVRRVGAGREARPAGRPVRQAALLRPGDPRRRDAAGLPRRRGQRLRLHPRVAHPRPARGCSTSTTPPRRPSTWCAPSSPVATPTCARCTPGTPTSCAVSSAGQRYEAMAAEIDKALAFMTRDRRRPRGAQAGRLPLQPRGAAAGVRARDDPHRLAHREALQRLRPLRLDRRAHPPARRRARGVLPPHPEPDRLQARPVRDAPTTPSRSPRGSTRTTSRAGSPSSPASAPARSATACPSWSRRSPPPASRSRGCATRCTATPSSRAPATRPAASTT